MNSNSDLSLEALRNAHRALKRGDRRAARRWAERAVSVSPRNEDAWLTLAAVASPRASLVYLKRALEINPDSQRARTGIHWAVQRLRSQPERSLSIPRRQEQIAESGEEVINQYLGDTQPVKVKPEPRKAPIRPHIQVIGLPIPAQAMVKRKPVLLPWILLILFIAAFTLAWNVKPYVYDPLAPEKLALLESKPTQIIELKFENLENATSTPTNLPPPTDALQPIETATPLPTETQVPTPSDTPTLKPTKTLEPTEKPTKKPTKTPTKAPKPTKTPEPQAVNYTNSRPAHVGSQQRWIDVDLTNQTTHAMLGDVIMHSFIVSTGTWRTPTVTGIYRIYVKYSSADMSGDDYYLPDVPYVMYFFGDYGIHGTYWHNNFGVPMSHGCVNLRPDDAGWLFDWASVGTVVNIHY